MSIPVPQRFLDDITRHVQAVLARRLRPNRLAVVDPAYSAATFPGALPRVTYEGESTLTTKRFNVAGGYVPQPGDRVLMVPVGSTYVILGKLAG